MRGPAAPGPGEGLLRLDPWLVFILGASLASVVSGDAAFKGLDEYLGLNGEGLRALCYVGATLVLAALAAATALGGPRRYPAYKRLALGLLLALLVGGPVLARVVLRPRAERPLEYAHDGGVIQTEAAARLLLRGENPYVADYDHTPLAAVAVPGIRVHYPYLPLSFLLPAPLIAAADAAGVLFDQRFVHLALYLVGLWLVPRAFRDPGVREVALTLFALNPLVVPFLIVGRNEILVIVLLLASWVALTRERWTVALVLLGLASASKQFAWLAAPFFLVYAAVAAPRRAFVRALAAGGGAAAALLAPFLLWSPGDFVADTLLFNAGLTAAPYPLGGTPGYGFAMLPALWGWVEDRFAYFPLFPFVLLAAGPLYWVLLRRLGRRPEAGKVLTYAFVCSFAVFFFSRVFHTNYLGYLGFLLGMGCLAEVDRLASAGYQGPRGGATPVSDESAGAGKRGGGGGRSAVDAVITAGTPS